MILSNVTRWYSFCFCTSSFFLRVGKGRHDPCVLPRAVPMVEAMVALTIVDALMQHKAQCELFAPGTDLSDENQSNTLSSSSEKLNPLGKRLHGYGV